MDTQHPIVPRPGDMLLLDVPGGIPGDTPGDAPEGVTGAAPGDISGDTPGDVLGDAPGNALGEATRPRLLHITRVVRPYVCAATADERRYGCYWVIGDDDEEYVVTAEVSGRYTRTFRPCSGS